MVFFDLLKMTRTKLIILAIFLITQIPSYINLSCIDGYCQAGAEVCACRFLPIEFFVTFVWMYVFACMIGEFITFLKKHTNKLKKTE
jgi:hypothetical protein